MFCKLCLKEWLPAIAANRKTLQVKKGEVIFREGDIVEGMFFVYTGTIKVHKRWGDKELIVRFAKNGNIVGHRGLGSELVYPVSATAIELSTVCFIDMNFFKSSLKVNHDFLYELMMFFAEELKLSERKMRDMAHMPVKGRIANSLLILKEKFGVTATGYINLAISRQELASYAGTTYETLFRMLNELVESGLVQLSDKEIKVLKEDQLRSIAHEGNA